MYMLIYRRVYFKLAFFSVSLFVAPIAAYYYSKDRWFGGAYFLDLSQAMLYILAV